jgi:hypothetical protein
LLSRFQCVVAFHCLYCFFAFHCCVRWGTLVGIRLARGVSRA